MLATLVEAPFDGDAWLFEAKWDGVRALCTVRAGGRVTLVSRNGLSLLNQFPELRALGEAFKSPPVVVDGEIVTLDQAGRSSFQGLQRRLNREHPDARLRAEVPVLYVAFDLLHAAGRDLRGEPLHARKALLERSIRSGAHNVLYSKHTVGKGKALYRAAQKHGLEGIVGKRLDSPYRERRSRDWVKIKVQRRQECVIGGWTQPRASREQFGALLLGLYRGKRLQYVGHVGTGFTRQLLADIMRRLVRLQTPDCPFESTPRTNTRSHWVKPRLVAEIKFAEWTRDGVMRQPVFMGLRIDKNPAQCVRETPVTAAAVH